MECPYTFWTSRLGTMSTSLTVELVPVLNHHLTEELFLLFTLNFTNTALSCFLASYHQAPEISTTLSVTLNLTSSSAPHRSCPVVLSPSLLPSFGHILLFYIIPTLQSPTSCSSWGEAAPMLCVVRQSPFSNQVAVLCSVYPRIQLDILATRAHCWLIKFMM